MAVTTIPIGRSKSLGVAAFAATAATTAAPDANTVALDTGQFDRIRTFITYSGTVNSAALRLWIYNRINATWHRGASTADVNPLAPGGASAVNESRDWFIGRHQTIYFQLEAVAGGGTVAVTAVAVWSEVTS